MKFLKVFFLLSALLPGLSARSQQTELFLALQTGSPFSLIDDGQAPLLVNFNAGIEQYVIDRLGIAVSFRKPFYLVGKENNLERKELFDYDGYTYIYTEEYDSYALDIESKFFFEGTNDDGMYLSSGISFQHLTMTVRLQSVDQTFSTSPPNGLPFMYPGRFKDEMNINPLSFRIGHRTSGDVLVLDYFFGIAFNLGVDSIKRLNAQYFDYYKMKTVSFPLGMKLGLKF